MAALSIATLLSWGVLYYSLPVLSPRVSEETGWSPALLAGVYSATLVGAALAGAALGKVFDHAGDLRKVMPWFSSLGAAGMALSTTGSLPAFITGWVFVGIAQAGTLWGPAFIAITRWFNAGDSAKPMMVITAVGGSAALLFAPLTANIANLYGWRTATIILAAGYLTLSLPVQFFGLRTPWQIPEHERVVTRADIHAITFQRRFLILQFCMLVAGTALFGVTLSLMQIAVERGASYIEASFIFGLVGLGQVLGRVGMTLIPLPHNPTSRLRILMISAACALAILAIAPVVLPLAIMAALAGALRGWHTLMMRSGVTERWGTTHFGAVMGRFNFPVAIGIALSPVIGVGLAGLTGGYVWAVLAVAVALGGCAMLVSRT